MEVLDDRTPAVPPEKGRAGLDLVYGLLAGPSSDSLSLDRLLAQLAGAFGAGAAGLAGPAGSDHPFACRVRADGQTLPLPRFPWDEDADLLARVRRSATAVTLHVPNLGSCLTTFLQTPDNTGWLLWLEKSAGHGWDPADAVTLVLASLTLTRWTVGEPGRPRWARQLEGAGRQRRLADAAAVVRRLAHDFGNVLTGILGFSELALNQVYSDSPVLRFLRETHRAAEQGAELVRLLRLFGSRRVVPGGASPLPAAIAAETARLQPTLGLDVELVLDVPANLPAVAISDDLLRTVLAQLLANAREALAGPGRITVSARRAELSAADCPELLGDAGPGPCVEVAIGDTGSGLGPEARRRLFTEPFYSSKPRHRGLGLAAVYGILHSHGGGFRLEPGAGGGTVVRLFLPLAAAPVVLSSPAPARAGEKVLVVDDDPIVLEMVGITLASAGYRVQTVGCPTEALDSYTQAALEPFQLVISDLLMPRMNGFDLARQLRSHDANANVLFMSGESPPELAQGVRWPHDLLSKPFRPETLLRAVRTALDRSARKESIGRDGSGEESIVPPSH